MDKLRRSRLTSSLLCIALVLVFITGCSERDTIGKNSNVIIASVGNHFASYKPIPVSYTPSVIMEPVKDDFSNVYRYNDSYFQPTEKELLKKNLFLLRPGYRDKMYEVYESKDLPAFISSDAVLHAYHQVFDSALMQSEKQFYKDLKILSSALYRASLEKYKNAQDKELKEAARLNAAYFGVATRLLGESIKPPADIDKPIKAELSLINKRAGYSVSPIFDYEEDYSQFVPRGHYTKSAELKRYFKAMVWYGRMNFHLRINPPDPKLVERHTRQAVLITYMIRGTKAGNDKAFNLWQRIYDPTAFFIGYSDDLNIRDYLPVVDKIYGKSPSDEKLADDGLLQEFIDEALKLRPPKISSTGAGLSPEDEMGFKLMGQRLVPDSYIFQELVYPKTDRSMPKGLDIPAVFGSERAYEILDKEYEETKDEQYVKKIGELKDSQMSPS
ncbi:MAG: DUF3160 domain-containing protein [Actinobacteria bacterium]|nr:DUF3160 domain-containing protein [Actinomycetota bacterium]